MPSFIIKKSLFSFQLNKIRGITDDRVKDQADTQRPLSYISVFEQPGKAYFAVNT
jgi:hypothetical protein